jgi:intracellular septation protein A
MSLDSRENSAPRFRSMMHIVMGIIYLFFGVVVIYMRYFGTIQLSTTIAYVLGGLLFVYGGFRVWRGAMQLRR